MWQRYILPSAALLALAIFPAMLSASAEPFPTVMRGDVYTEELVRINPDGSRIVKWTSSPPRIFHNGEYKDYVLYQDAGTVRLETGNAGSLVFNKSTCSYDFYEAGLITQSSVPAVKNISW
ncbi:MAG: hypothetical protein LV468_01320, partial [Candidatus Nitrosotenuis sp.]|nr:hypothetical protein [Candidatus Nitrosotenuis sp.]